MRILISVSGTKVNGVLTYCKTLIAELTDAGHQVFIIHRKGSWIGENVGQEIGRLECQFHRSVGELKRIALWIKSNNIDIVHTHMSSANLFGILLKPFIPCPVVATAHTCSFQPYWRIFDFVFATSDFTLEQQRKVNWVVKEKSKTVHCFANSDPFQRVFRERLNSTRNVPKTDDNAGVSIAVIGEVCPRKGHVVLMEALGIVNREGLSWNLKIIGDYQSKTKYTQAILNHCIQLGILESVQFIGIKNCIADELREIDICVVPSLQEPLGLVAVEAGLAGVPVIASRVGGLSEVVEENVTGLLVPPNDSPSLARAIQLLADDSSMRQQFGASANDRLTREFDSATLTSDILSEYQRLVK